MQGCEKLVELPEELAMCPMLNTLTLWGCIVLTQMPDLTPLPKLQIDGVPEQLADWEAEQKRKRAEDLAAGRVLKGKEKAAPVSGWKEAAKALFGGDKKASVAQVADAALAALGGE